MKSISATKTIKYANLYLGKTKKENLTVKEYFNQQYDRKLNMNFSLLPYAVELPLLSGLIEAIEPGDSFFAAYPQDYNLRNLIAQDQKVEVMSSSLMIYLTNTDAQ